MTEAEQLRTKYLSVLDQQQQEQTYQTFLETNTRLIPREFIQGHGIHLHLALRKLSFAADFKSDFFYLSKSSGDWNCIFIELEKPSSRYFRENSDRLHPDFMAATQQVKAWKAWFMSSDNKRAFENETIGILRTPFPENPCNMKYVLVHGRRSEIDRNIQRRRLIASYEDADFKIVSFDSLAENLEAKHNLYVGSRHNSYIDILSGEFCGHALFQALPPEQVRIGDALKAKLPSASA